MKTGFLSGILGALFFLSGAACFAQKTAAFLDPDAEFKTGIELFERQRYGSARQVFQHVMESRHPAASQLLKTDAGYYAALCALELFHKDGELRLLDFIEKHPESPRIAKAYYNLGRYNYRRKKYKKAIEFFEKTDHYALNSEELSELHFKKGYSYFEEEQIENAKKSFYEVKDTNSAYISSAIYYASHILYNEGNYERALRGFLRLTSSGNFGPIVPYYIAQIYFLQGKYDDVIAYAPSLLDSSNTKRTPEIARIIGESYYKTERYKEAVPYLQRYEAAKGPLSRQDEYQLGYSLYRSGNPESAVTYFQNITAERDTLSENAWYHLAGCYLKMNRKPLARNAFRSASKMRFDPVIHEDALFQYARLSYELSLNPYNDAVNALNTYIKEYPNSTRLDEAYEYLVNVYLTTKNYRDGLSSIEKISKLNDKLKPVYQKLAYNRATELYNHGSYDDAADHFDKSRLYPINRAINVLSSYWKAECFYRKAEAEKDKSLYAQAIDQYKAFLLEPGAIMLPLYTGVNYDVAYSYFQQKDYATAILWFRKYALGKAGTTPEKRCNSYVRLGDCYFISKDFSSAAEFYGEAIKMKSVRADKDYAYYQQSQAWDVLNKQDAKAAALNELIAQYPASPYQAAAKYELGNTYLAAGQPENALVYYQKVINDHPKSAYLYRSKLQIGQIHYNKKEDDNALAWFEDVLKQAQRSEEGNEAMDQIRKIYKAKGDVDGLERIAKKYGFETPVSSLDSMAYAIGKDHYYEKKCDLAIQDFSKYIQKFPDGVFILDVNYYKAECEYSKGNTDIALGHYNFVIDHSRGKNIYLESSIVNAARISYKSKYYEAALRHYDMLADIAESPGNFLDARTGQMRCNFNLKRYPAAIDHSRNVLVNERSGKELRDEAHFTIARSELEQNNLDNAYLEFAYVARSAKNQSRSESKYNLAYIQYLKQEYKAAEKQVFEIIKDESSNAFWLDKSFLLLGDNYLAQGDTFQAKTTWQALLENGEVESIKSEAQQRIRMLEEAKHREAAVKREEELQVPLNGESKAIFKEDDKEE